MNENSMSELPDTLGNYPTKQEKRPFDHILRAICRQDIDLSFLSRQSPEFIRTYCELSIEGFTNQLHRQVVEALERYEKE